MAKPYRHRQIGWMFLVPIAVVLIPFTVIVFIASDQWWLGVLLAIVMFFVYGSFATLNTKVERGEVRAHFTFGWPSRTIPLAAIASHQPVRNRWWHGWGIRLIPGGMLYSVWGLDAVEIHYRDTKKGKDRMFRVGTDDADGLDAAISAARASRR